MSASFRQDCPSGWVIIIDWVVDEDQPGDEDGMMSL